MILITETVSAEHTKHGFTHALWDSTNSSMTIPSRVPTYARRLPTPEDPCWPRTSHIHIITMGCSCSITGPDKLYMIISRHTRCKVLIY